MLTEIPKRTCQALGVSVEAPRHPAEVVCNRDGLEWFSCREHAPKSVKVLSLREWYVKHGLLERTWTGITLQELADEFEIPLFVGDPRTVADPLGVSRKSPNAQACKAGVCAASIDKSTAYSICHEMAHVIVGYPGPGGESEVMDVHRMLAEKLSEPARSRALQEVPHG